jgi:hypothetical protein
MDGRRATIAWVASAWLASAVALGTATGSAAAPIQSQDTNWSGVVMELTEVKRKENVLTVKLKLVNSSDGDASVELPYQASDYDKFYVTAKDKKYMILRDSEKVPVAAPAKGDFKLAKGASFTWWAKYPAPPPEVTKIEFYTPDAPPFEDVPITD